MVIYRVEQDAPLGSGYAECFFEVFAKNEHEAWNKAIEIADYRILRIWLVRSI